MKNLVTGLTQTATPARARGGVGTPGGIRTPDTQVRSLVLYPLSYGRALGLEPLPLLLFPGPPAPRDDPRSTIRGRRSEVASADFVSTPGNFEARGFSLTRRDVYSGNTYPGINFPITSR